MHNTLTSLNLTVRLVHSSIVNTDKQINYYNIILIKLNLFSICKTDNNYNIFDNKVKTSVTIICRSFSVLVTTGSSVAFTSYNKAQFLVFTMMITEREIIIIISNNIASVGGATRHTVIVRVCLSVRSSSERQRRISWW